MDTPQLQELSNIASKQVKLAEQYAQQREIAGKAKTEIEIRLVANLPRIRTQKSNVGIEMAYFMLMEIDPTIKDLYREWKEAEARYKGLEKILEANASNLMLHQSILKYEHLGNQWGA